MITNIAREVFGLVDDLFTSDEERLTAKRRLESEAGQRKLRDLQVRLSAILAEANSADPWTSRARPAFLYVMYVMILASIPMGGLHAFNPQMAESVTYGIGNWLNSIPDSLWTLFGAGYLGYSAVRTVDKRRR